MEIVDVNSAAIKLTDIILGKNKKSWTDVLKDIASEIGMLHISFVRFASNRSWDVSILTSISTHTKIWQTRYFLKRYALVDPIVRHGSAAILPFDWDTLPTDYTGDCEVFCRRQASRRRAQRAVNSRAKSQKYPLGGFV